MILDCILRMVVSLLVLFERPIHASIYLICLLRVWAIVLCEWSCLCYWWLPRSNHGRRVRLGPHISRLVHVKRPIIKHACFLLQGFSFLRSAHCIQQVRSVFAHAHRSWMVWWSLRLLCVTCSSQLRFRGRYIFIVRLLGASLCQETSNATVLLALFHTIYVLFLGFMSHKFCCWMCGCRVLGLLSWSLRMLTLAENSSLEALESDHNHSHVIERLSIERVL